MRGYLRRRKITPHAVIQPNKSEELKISANCGSIDGNTIDKLQVLIYPPITKKLAVRVIHSKVNTQIGYRGYTTKDFLTQKAINDYLSLIYSQGVVKWVVEKLPAMTIDFDDNQDYKLNMNGWPSSEMTKIINLCKDDDYEYNIFIVDNFFYTDYPGELVGKMKEYQKFGFITTTNNADPLHTIAHELGHGVYDLKHTGDAEHNYDEKNVMYNFQTGGNNYFRKDQWDAMHP